LLPFVNGSLFAADPEITGVLDPWADIFLRSRGSDEHSVSVFGPRDGR